MLPMPTAEPIANALGGAIRQQGASPAKYVALPIVIRRLLPSISWLMDTPDAAVQYPDEVTALSERVDEAMAELSAMQSSTDPAEVVMFLSMMAERRNMALPAPSLLAMDARAIAAALPADLWPVACDRLWSTFSYRRLPECPDFLAAVADELAERREAAAKIQTAHLKVRHLKWLSERRRECEARHTAIKLRERNQHVEASANDIEKAASAAPATDHGPPASTGVHSANPNSTIMDEPSGRTLPRDEDSLASGSRCLAYTENVRPFGYRNGTDTASFLVVESTRVRCDNPEQPVLLCACRSAFHCSPETAGHQLPGESLVSRRQGAVIARSVTHAVTAQRTIKSRFADTELFGSIADGVSGGHQSAGEEKIRLRQSSGAPGLTCGQGLSDGGSHCICFHCPTYHENHQLAVRQLSECRRQYLPEDVQQRIRRVRYQGNRYSRHSRPPSFVVIGSHQYTPLLSHYNTFTGTYERENDPAPLHGDAKQARIHQASRYRLVSGVLGKKLAGSQKSNNKPLIKQLELAAAVASMNRLLPGNHHRDDMVDLDCHLPTRTGEMPSQGRAFRPRDADHGPAVRARCSENGGE
jgi:hypothetical protein